MFIAKGLKSSLQRELDSFYQEVTGSDFNIRHVTKGAFSQARAKLNPTAFTEMNEVVVNTFYDEAPYKVWNNMRLLAVDGSRIQLPNHPSVKEEFGEHRFGPDAAVPKSMALISFLYDPLNLIVLDGQIAPFASSERALLYKHLEKAKQGDLLLVDRGYPSLALIFLLHARGLEFCMRMKDNWWLPVKEFSESDKKEAIAEFELPAKDQDILKDYPELWEQKVRCRLVKIDLPDGNTEILCTSLLDSEKYTIEDIGELYHFRWNEEEGFKLLKARMEVENFSGKTATAVKQDFFAKVFIMTLTANLAFPVEEKVRKEYSEDKQGQHPQKINRTSAVSLTCRISIKLFLKKMIREAIAAFDAIMLRTKEIVRPGRKNPRKKKPPKSHHMNYKPL